MIPSINIAVTGLHTAAKRLANSGNNVANIHSTFTTKNGVTTPTPFVPQRIDGVSLEPTGGVRTVSRPVTPASISVYDPDNGAANEEGITQYPNVNLEEEVVGQMMAGYDYKANLKTIKTADSMLKSLLNIFS